MFTEASSVRVTWGWAASSLRRWTCSVSLSHGRVRPGGTGGWLHSVGRQRRVVTKDHAGRANPNLIAIVERSGAIRDKSRALHEDTMRGLEIFDDEGGPALEDTRVVATDTEVGQTEKTRRMPSEHRGVGQRYLRSTVESLNHV